MRSPTGIFMFLLVSLATALCASADDIPFEFENAQHELLYNNLVNELRCMVCQNQSLADSHAPLAQDLRNEVYRMVLADSGKKEIIDFLVQRYGDFVLYRPPLKLSTALLWFGPFLLLLLGAIISFRIVSNKTTTEVDELDPQQEEKIRQLLQEDGQEKQP